MRTNPRKAPEADEFDPTLVPVFPVLTVEITGHELLVDGRVEPIPADTDPADAAVAAAAEAVRRRGLDYCRVSAIVDGTAYPLVVGADGSRHDLSKPNPRAAARAGKPSAGRAWVLPVAVMIFALVTAGVVVATVHQFRGKDRATAAPAAPTPSPTELPVLPPDGWSTHATWAISLASLSRSPVVAHNGVVLAVTDDDTLTAHDAATGAAISHAVMDGTLTAGPVLTTVDDQAVIAVATRRALYWWPEARNLSDARRAALDPRAQVTFAGRSPLIILPGQHAATVVAGVLSDRTIPAGARAVRADGPVVTALDAGGRVWRLTSTQPHVPAPIATLRAPHRGQVPSLLGSTSAHLVISWRSAGASGGSLSIATLGGATVTRRDVPALSAGDDWTASPTTAVAARHIFALKPSPRIVPITDPTWKSLRIVNETIYGTTGGRESAILNARTGAAVRQQSAEATAPLAVDPEHAYVAAETPTGAVLYALQRSE